MPRSGSGHLQVLAMRLPRSSIFRVYVRAMLPEELGAFHEGDSPLRLADVQKFSWQLDC